jgi:chromosome segregation ATPase
LVGGLEECEKSIKQLEVELGEIDARMSALSELIASKADSTWEEEKALYKERIALSNKKDRLQEARLALVMQGR